LCFLDTSCTLASLLLQNLLRLAWEEVPWQQVSSGLLCQQPFLLLLPLGFPLGLAFWKGLQRLPLPILQQSFLVC
jgi:hypothetical protein